MNSYFPITSQKLARYLGVNPFYHKNLQDIAIVKKNDGNLAIVIMRFGRASDFKVGKCFFVMTGVWENRRESAKSYDE